MTAILSTCSGTVDAALGCASGIAYLGSTHERATGTKEAAPSYRRLRENRPLTSHGKPSEPHTRRVSRRIVNYLSLGPTRPRRLALRRLNRLGSGPLPCLRKMVLMPKRYPPEVREKAVRL